MSTGPSVEGTLVQWGERLFYPPNRIVRPQSPPRLNLPLGRKAAVIRGRITATVTRRAPQVMVKVTGGGRGMAAIAAHFRYISKNGRLEIEDDRGVVHCGKESLRDLADQWRHGGALIPEEGNRREAFNLMLSMPRGTDPSIVHRAAREFAATELAGYRYLMVLHDHQANPHVHLSVRATGRDGSRLNPRKADLHRWRETFAEKLRGWGIDAEASRQATRGENRRFEELWRGKARAGGRLSNESQKVKTGDRYHASRTEAVEAWARISEALRRSERPEDQVLARDIVRFVRGSPFLRELARSSQRKVAGLELRAPLPRDAMPRGGADVDMRR